MDPKRERTDLAGGGAGTAPSSSSRANAAVINQYSNNYSHAVLVLQTPSAPLDDQVAALRFLQMYLKQETTLTDLKRRQINQLVLDNVMDLVMNEERSSDLRKRQLVRTECFLMLAKLLDSQTLFGNVKARVTAAEAEDNEQEHIDPPTGPIIEDRSAVVEVSSSAIRPRAPSAPGSDDPQYSSRYLAAMYTPSTSPSTTPSTYLLTTTCFSYIWTTTTQSSSSVLNRGKKLPSPWNPPSFEFPQRRVDDVWVRQCWCDITRTRARPTHSIERRPPQVAISFQSDQQCA